MASPDISPSLSSSASWSHHSQEIDDDDDDDDDDADSERSQAHGRKRKADAVLVGRSSPKRLKMREVEPYRQLLNFELQRVEQHERSSRGQVAASPGPRSIIWSEAEKDQLFLALERKGRHDYKSLAAAVATRSQLEVRAYIQALQSAAYSHDYSALHRKLLFDMSRIEAAAEVEPACVAALEVAADTLAAQHFSHEKSAEQSLHAGRWLITQRTARWIEGHVKAGEVGERILARDLPFASLLNVKNFLNLSRHLFMNSTDPDRNWRAIRESKITDSATPSVFNSAFSDLHSLLLARTRRLVQLSVFFACSRLNAEANSAVQSNIVRVADVITAVNVAGFPVDSTEYWPTIARRCKLRVYEHVSSRQFWGKRYSYEEVATYLRSNDDKRGRYISRQRDKSSEPHGQHASSEDISDGEETSRSESYSSSAEATSNGESDGSSPTSSLSPPPALTQDSLAHRHEQQVFTQDDFLESLDVKIGRSETRRLWAVLGQQSSSDDEEGEDNPSSPKRPLPPGRKREDFTDWRDWIEYWDQWETPVGVVPNSNFDDLDDAASRSSTASNGAEVEHCDAIDELDSDARKEARGEAMDGSDDFVQYSSGEGSQAEAGEGAETETETTAPSLEFDDVGTN